MGNQPRLLPCPFCGGPAEVQSMEIGKIRFAVHCPRAGCCLGPQFYFPDDRNARRRAIAAWNMRAPVAPPAPGCCSNGACKDHPL